MLLTPIAIIIGLGIGFARGGSFGPWPAQPIRLLPVLAAGLVFQAGAEFIDVPARPAVAAVGWLLLAVAMAANLHLGGAGVMALGMVANAVPILLNGAVPVSPDALVTSGRLTEAELANATVNAPWELETSETTLGILGDTIPLRITADIVSFGDLLIAAGLIFFAMNVVMQWATGRRHLALARRGRTELDVIDLADGPAAPAAHTPIDLTADPVPTGASSIWSDEFETAGASDSIFDDPGFGDPGFSDPGFGDQGFSDPSLSDQELATTGMTDAWQAEVPVERPTPTTGGISVSDWLGDADDAVLDLTGEMPTAAERHGVTNLRKIDQGR